MQCFKGCFGDAQCSSNNRLVYSYRMTEISCQQWDETEQRWRSDTCILDVDNCTPQQANFKSNLFGSMGAGLVVGPNTIDFSTVFDNLDQKIAEVL